MKRACLIVCLLVAVVTTESSAQRFRNGWRGFRRCHTTAACCCQSTNGCSPTSVSMSATQSTSDSVIYDSGVYATSVESQAVTYDSSGSTIVNGPTVVDGSTIIGDGYSSGAATIASSPTSGIPTIASGNPVRSVSYATSSHSLMMMGAGDALSVVNQKRMSRGLPALRYDPNLASVAMRKSQIRASRRITGHDGSSKGGARVEGVGYASGGNLQSQFSTCYLYSTGFSAAGAAISYDGNGKAYYTLLLR